MYFCGVDDEVLFVMTEIYYYMSCRVIEKMLHEVTGIVLVAVMCSRNGCRRYYYGKWWCREGASCVCVMGGELEESGDGKVTYVEGLTKCIMLKEGMAVEEVLRLVTDITGSDLCERKLWYNLKYGRPMLMAVEEDVDVRIIFKRNNEHGYLYVGGIIAPTNFWWTF